MSDSREHGPRHRADPAEGGAADDVTGTGDVTGTALAAEQGEAPEAFDDLMDRLAAEQQEEAEQTARADAARAGAARETAEGPGTGAADGPVGATGSGEDRTEPPLLGDEAAVLDGFLAFLRATVLFKTEGLTDELASHRPLGSLTTVTGLLRHLADVERYWFREVMGGVPEDEVGYRWMDTSAQPDLEAEFRLEAGASVEEARADYREACEASVVQRSQRALEEEVRGAGETRSVRWIVTHMIEETARHTGQLDVLTELLDGRTGE